MDCIELRERDWIVTTDTVMGGLSTLSVVSDCTGLRLQGEVRHENNGGFVSARTRSEVISCPKDAIGVRVFWKGDARTYRLVLHEKDRRVREYFECALSQTSETLLWADFTYRYRKMRDAGRQINPNQLNSMGILLSNTYIGTVDFHLQRLEWVLP